MKHKLLFLFSLLQLLRLQAQHSQILKNKSLIPGPVNEKISYWLIGDSMYGLWAHQNDSAASASLIDSSKEKAAIQNIPEPGSSDIILYPNPTKGLINVKTASAIENYSIYNIIGEKLVEDKFQPYQIKFPETMVGGVYFIHFKLNQKELIKRVLLER